MCSSDLSKCIVTPDGLWNTGTHQLICKSQNEQMWAPTLILAYFRSWKHGKICNDYWCFEKIMFILTILMHFLLWHIFKIHIKFKAYRDISAWLEDLFLGSWMVYCVQVGERGKGWGYSPFFGFLFLFSLFFFLFFRWGKLQMLTWNYHVLYLWIVTLTSPVVSRVKYVH